MRHPQHYAAANTGQVPCTPRRLFVLTCEFLCELEDKANKHNFLQTVGSTTAMEAGLRIKKVCVMGAGHVGQYLQAALEMKSVDRYRDNNGCCDGIQESGDRI